MEDGDIYENVPKDKSSSQADTSRGVHGGYILMTDKRCLKCQLNANPNIKCKCQDVAGSRESNKIPQCEDYENMKVTRIRNMEKIETLKKQALQKEATLTSKGEMRIYDNPVEENSQCACCVIL